MSTMQRLTRAHQECVRYLDEAFDSQDPDLMEELSAKMNDVLVVYRRNPMEIPHEPDRQEDGSQREPR